MAVERSRRPASCVRRAPASRAFLPNLLVFPSSGRARMAWVCLAPRRLRATRRETRLCGTVVVAGIAFRRRRPPELTPVFVGAVRRGGRGGGAVVAGGGRGKQGHLVDALGPRGDEGRGTLRKARGSREQALSPGSPNGATHPARGIRRRIHRRRRRTRGTETSQYPEERTSTETPSVAASERGPGQWRACKNRNRLESRAIAGDSPVRVESRLVLE